MHILFLFGAIIIGAGIILTVISYRKYKYIKHLEKIRVRIAGDLHDDIGAALSSISFYSEAARLNVAGNKPDEVAKIVEKIGFTSRQTIEAMSDIVWMVNPKNDKLEKLFEQLENFGNELLITKNISFLFYTDSALAHTVMPIDHRKNFYLICKEALHNAAKYSGASVVELLIKKKKREIITMIKDNGNGFDIENVKSGNGLLNMRVRAQTFGSKMLIDSKPGKGTTITFSLPYPHNG